MSEVPAPHVDPLEAMAATGIGCFEWDPATGRFTLDAGGLAVFDLRPSEYDGTAADLAQRIPVEYETQLFSLVEDIIAGRSDSYSSYFKIQRRDGTLRWTHTQGQVVHDPGRPGIRVVGVVRDATRELTHSALRLLAEDDRRRQEDELREVAQALGEALTVEDVVGVLTGDQSMRRLGVQGITLGVVDQGRVRLVGAVGEVNVRVREVQRARLSEPWPLNDAVRSGEPLFFTSRSVFLRHYPVLTPYVGDSHATAAAFLPLIAQGRPIGAIALVYEGKRGFSSEDRTLLTALSSAIAQSLQRAMLVDQSREIAAGLQSAMLPRRLPSVPGGKLAVRYRTARVGTWIGGDWYDAVPLAGGAVGVAIGDVQGHDTEAAAVMGQLRIAMTAYAAEGHSSESVLKRASAFLTELHADRFATCLYAQVSMATGEVRAANAGHLPPLVRHADGTVERIEVAGGPPLGLPAEWGPVTYPRTTFRLAAGDTLLLYSDGLVERPGEDLDQGLDRLAEVFAAGPTRLSKLADHVRDTLSERLDAEDDAALLLLHRDAGPH
ncbi:serine phosphatase RsbU (regulator of sigma subunit) [Kitasatospora sp. MAP12-15]|uniref:SpoIIE family protein phosphatase n=1 Tax=unclassified Kitasatospora TaxID=2633591 RepID=UPI00247641C1|nr:SpoIIE family protein phosphatase [Kitasatospora sp. MAP12-44]MDH6108985.1 serine phosphatase RsbU (regulator of sigma subunit) [Kitasatospora sp. MAP12-44]